MCESWYRGDDGAEYLLQRANAISKRNQNLRAQLFLDLTKKEDIVLDFGCGTGGILERLPASARIGVEIGAEASTEARNRGLEVVSDLSIVQDDSVDVAITFHALEHVDNPLLPLVEMNRVLKPNGMMRAVVPCQYPLSAKERTWEPDMDRHLYTWTPLLLGNLAFRAGFTEIHAHLEPMPCGSRLSKLLPNSRLIRRYGLMLQSIKNGTLNTVVNARKSIPA